MPKALVLQTVLKWSDNGVPCYDPVEIAVFLCGRCDRIHVQMHTASGADLILDLSELEAERIAKALLAPAVARPGDPVR